jgi:hypothetical protein
MIGAPARSRRQRSCCRVASTRGSADALVTAVDQVSVSTPQEAIETLAACFEQGGSVRLTVRGADARENHPVDCGIRGIAPNRGARPDGEAALVASRRLILG